MKLSTSLDVNISKLKDVFPIGKSFDIITRDLYLGETRAFWIGINGFCNLSVLQSIFSDLQNPIYTKDTLIKNISSYLESKIGYAQAELTDDFDKITKNLMSGPSMLFIDGFDQAIILDARSYPTRGIDEPDTEKVTMGARDGFVETVLFNTNLIRRRIRNPNLTFEIKTIGTDSKTDVVIAYISQYVDHDLLKKLNDKIDLLDVSSLTMGSKSLEELLIKKRWYNPLPSIYITERPDVACSFLMEGYILLLVDNSPTSLVMPTTFFQFTQSPEDYYKSAGLGNYIRLIRFACLLASLFLLPVFFLISAYFPALADTLGLMKKGDVSPQQIFMYVIFVEMGLDVFKYSSSHSASGFANSLSIIGGLIIGDIAIELKWASQEVIFYAAVTMLATLSLANIEFGESIRLYRIFLIICTGFFGIWGFAIGLLLILISIITTPTFGGKSFFWPLRPFNWEALKTILVRCATLKSQPSKVWSQKSDDKN
ncbi:MAG: spore germination protein [Lachnospiraceae bacterium]|nr:spore germination protein [Lachnospiraceae bacterium]